jgi:hypothetical protein
MDSGQRAVGHEEKSPVLSTEYFASLPTTLASVVQTFSRRTTGIHELHDLAGPTLLSYWEDFT